MRGVDLVAVGRRFDSLLLRISADGIDESRMSPGVGVGSGQFKGFICVCVCVSDSDSVSSSVCRFLSAAVNPHGDN
jgi:hypothetical protein